jgi:hypothetical protein
VIGFAIFHSKEAETDPLLTRQSKKKMMLTKCKSEFIKIHILKRQIDLEFGTESVV